MLRNGLEPWHVILVVIVVALLFGSKKLPDAARGLGKSLRIFKSEVTAMRSMDSAEDDVPPKGPQASQAPGAPEASTVPAATATADAAGFATDPAAPAGPPAPAGEAATGAPGAAGRTSAAAH
jgi:sec-independent protein translocase protein TatA